jgi:hypothetical protein
LYDFEKDYPLERFVLGPIPFLWPIVKIASQTRLFPKEERLNQSAEEVQTQSQVVNLLQQELSRIVRNCPANSPDTGNHVLQHPARGDVVILTSVPRRRFAFQHGLYDVYLDPIVEILKKNNISVSVMETGPRETYLKKRLYPSFFYGDVVLQAGAFARYHSAQIFPGIDLRPPSFFQDYVNWVWRENPEIEPLTWQEVLTSLGKILVLAQYFRQCFTSIKPRLIVVAAWKDDKNLAALLAGRQLRIPTIDFQHGAFLSMDVGYFHWPKGPQGGYPVMPNYIWFWGDHFKNIWLKNNALYEDDSALIGGSAWMHRWIYARDDLVTLKNHFRRYLLGAPEIESFTIAVTLTGRMCFHMTILEIAEFLKQIIVRTSGNYTWLVRLHPQENFLLEELKTSLAMLPHRIVIYEAHVVPILTLLETADVHLTFGSSTAFEALACRVPTIGVTDYSKKSMERLLEEKVGYFTKDPIEIARMIDNIHAGECNELDFVKLPESKVNRFSCMRKNLPDDTLLAFLERIFSQSPSH